MRRRRRWGVAEALRPRGWPAGRARHLAAASATLSSVLSLLKLATSLDLMLVTPSIASNIPLFRALAIAFLPRIIVSVIF